MPLVGAPLVGALTTLGTHKGHNPGYPQGAPLQPGRPDRGEHRYPAAQGANTIIDEYMPAAKGA